MTGEKIKPAIIGKSQHQRNFHLLDRLPIYYYSNKTAWMTGEIWLKVLKKLNRHIKEELNRHMIYLLLIVRLILIPALNFQISLLFFYPEFYFGTSTN